MSAGSRAANQRAMSKVESGDFSAGGQLAPEQFNQFFQEVQKQTEFLNRARAVPVSAESGSIPKLGVGERLIQPVAENDRVSLQNVDSSDISYQTTKVSLPFELSHEAVTEQIEGNAIEANIRNMFMQQFSVDLEDLGWNGDETNGSGFTAINDGWLTIADSRGAPSVSFDSVGDGSGTDQAISKDLFHQMLQSLDPKYKRSMDNLVFLISSPQYEAFKDNLTDRSTGAGDSMLLTGAQPTPYGANVITPTNFPDDRAVLTNPQNLLYMIQDDLRVKQTREGEHAVLDDVEVIYNMLSKIDYQVMDENAMVVADHIAAPA